MRIEDIAEDMMPSNIMAASSRATYIHNIRVRMMMMKHQNVLPFLGKLVKDSSAEKNLLTTDLHDPSL